MDTQQSPPPEPTAPVVVVDADDVARNKDLAAFSYLWVMSVVVYLIKRKSPFIRFHSKQGIVLFILSILVWFVPIINRLLALGVLALMVLGFVNAAQGKRADIPIVGPLSRREITVRQAWQQFVALVVWVANVLRGLFKKTPTPPTQEPPQPPPSPPSS